MQIGTLKLDVPLLLAPMAGITDLPFRVICRGYLEGDGRGNERSRHKTD